MKTLCTITVGALLTVSVALAQQPAPSSSTSENNRAMTPETSRDDQVMTPETAVDNPAPPPSRGAVRGGPTANAPAENTTQPEPANPQVSPQGDLDVGSTAQSPQRVSVLAGTAPADCWAKLYYADNFAGNNVTLLGPADVPDMEATFRSVEIGPAATMVLFGEENFADETGRYEPGRKAATLQQAPGLEAFESLRITCTPATG